MADNLDLQTRRKRLGLNQWQVAQLLHVKRAAYISEFETDDRKLPGGLTRDDYIALLERLERSQKVRAVK